MHITNFINKYPFFLLGFLLTVNGFSHHIDKRTYKADKVRPYNEHHNAIGLEYEKYDKNIVYGFGCVNFKNSYYVQSTACGGSYKLKTGNAYYSDYYGFKGGIVTGYEERNYNADGGKRYINEGRKKYNPFLFPTYSIKNENYEFEFSISPKRKGTESTTVLMLLIKFNLN